MKAAWILVIGVCLGLRCIQGRTEKDGRKRLEQGDARVLYAILTGQMELLKQGMDEGARINAPIDPFMTETVLRLGRAFRDYPVAPPLHMALNFGKRAQLNAASMLMRFHANPNRYELPPKDVYTPGPDEESNPEGHSEFLDDVDCTLDKDGNCLSSSKNAHNNNHNNKNILSFIHPRDDPLKKEENDNIEQVKSSRSDLTTATSSLPQLEQQDSNKVSLSAQGKQQSKTKPPLEVSSIPSQQQYRDYHHGYPPAAMYALGFGQVTSNSHAALLQRLYREYPQRFNLTILEEWRRMTGNPPLSHLMLYWQNFDGLYFLVTEWTKDVNEKAYSPAFLSSMDSASFSELTISKPPNYLPFIPRAETEWVDWSIDPYGLTPLHIAAWLGDVPATIFLLHNGADLFAKTYFYGHLPIHLAAFRHHSHIVALHIAYVIEKKRDKEEHWIRLIQTISQIPHFDTLFEQYVSFHKGKKTFQPQDICPKDTNQATRRATGETRDIIDYILLQPRNYALVPILTNISETWQFPIQAPPLQNPHNPSFHQGKAFQKQLSWEFVVNKLRLESKNEHNFVSSPITSTSRSKYKQVDSCLLPRAVDIVVASHFTKDIYREEYYILQRPVLITEGLAQGLGIWANVFHPDIAMNRQQDAFEPREEEEEGKWVFKHTQQKYQEFMSVFISRFGHYPAYVYANTVDGTVSREENSSAFETELANEILRMVYPKSTTLLSFFQHHTNSNSDLNFEDNNINSYSAYNVVLEAMITPDLYQQDFFTDMPSTSALHKYFLSICHVQSTSKLSSVFIPSHLHRYPTAGATNSLLIPPHLIPPHPHHEPFRLILTPSSTLILPNRANHEDTKSISIDVNKFKRLFTSGSTFLQQYTQTGYATGLYHEPYISELSNTNDYNSSKRVNNKSSFQHSVYSAAGKNRFASAHYDLLLSTDTIISSINQKKTTNKGNKSNTDNPKHWILIPPGQFTWINSSFSQPETQVFFQKQLQLVKDQVRQLRTWAHQTNEVSRYLVDLENMQLPKRIWSMNHAQLMLLFLPWLQENCIGIFEQVTQHVGDILVIPQDYFYFYYHYPMTIASPNDDDNMYLLRSIPSVSVAQSFCTWFDTDMHTQSLGYILYGHRYPTDTTAHSSDSDQQDKGNKATETDDNAMNPRSDVAEGNDCHKNNNNDTNTHRQSTKGKDAHALWIEDVWRGRMGVAPNPLYRAHKDIPEFSYPKRKSNVPIFDMPIH